MTNIIFKRRIDQTSYIYSPSSHISSIPAWKRNDANLWLIKHERLGWIIVDDNKTIYAISWDFILTGEPTETPPAGEWISKKGNKSYVYDLTYD